MSRKSRLDSTSRPRPKPEPKARPKARPERKPRPTPRSATRAALENRGVLAARALVDRMRTMYRELERMTGAPISMHRALVCVGDEPGLPASRLAILLGMQRPAVSQLLKSLTARGWIVRRRSDLDQRTVQIHATNAGRRILRATAGRAVFTLRRAVRGLPEKELGQLIAGVETLLMRLPAPLPSAAGRGRADAVRPEPP